MAVAMMIYAILTWHGLRLTLAASAAVAVALVAPGVCFAGGHGAAEETAEIDDAASDAKIRGIELGEFRIRSYHPVEAQKSTVRFKLYAAVAGEQFANVQPLVAGHKHRLRDQVIIATRMAPLALFDEAELTSFRRRILVRLRRALPQLPIDDVFVSDFHLQVKSL